MKIAIGCLIIGMGIWIATIMSLNGFGYETWQFWEVLLPAMLIAEATSELGFYLGKSKK